MCLGPNSATSYLVLVQKSNNRFLLDSDPRSRAHSRIAASLLRLELVKHAPARSHHPAVGFTHSPWRHSCVTRTQCRHIYVTRTLWRQTAASNNRPDALAVLWSRKRFFFLSVFLSKNLCLLKLRTFSLYWPSASAGISCFKRNGQFCVPKQAPIIFLNTKFWPNLTCHRCLCF